MTQVYAQNDPTFDMYQGTVYDARVKQLKKKFGDHVYDWPVLNTFEWKEINVSDRDTEEGFPNVEKEIAFGIVFTNTMTITEDACYEFILESDDGSVLWLNDELILANGGTHAMRERRDTTSLSPGTYDLRIWYYQAYPTRYGIIFKSNNIGQECKENALPENALPEVVEQKLTLNSHVLFDYNKYMLKPSIRSEMDSICNLIAKNNPKKVTFTGYTDDQGSSNYNLELSEKRADAVMQYVLNKIDVPSVMYIAKGKGEEQPLVPNDSEENRMKNRRVEIVIE